VTAPRSPVIIAGAGIGGLTASLALAARGFRIILLEQAERLEEVGAGLQLSPNASRILIALGLEAELTVSATRPDGVSVMSARRGAEVVRLPLENSEGPYWVIHRADLQAALAGRVAANPDVELRLGSTFEGVAPADGNIVVTYRSGSSSLEERASALIGADGLWSAVRRQLFPDIRPQFTGLIAWRATIEAAALGAASAPRRVQLWLAPNAHLVAYPIAAGRQINLVAITRGTWNEPGWNTPAGAAEIVQTFAAPQWSEPARTLIGAAAQWRKWALFALPEQIDWTDGATALLGDAAHAMLPFAAQGAGMAIEDAAVLAGCLAEQSANLAAAMRRYAAVRRPRVTRVQRLAQRNGAIYHLSGPAAVARDLGMQMLGGRRLLARQNWIYDWRL
jgi:salicylate hydroxylase